MVLVFAVWSHFLTVPGSTFRASHSLDRVSLWKGALLVRVFIMPKSFLSNCARKPRAVQSYYLSTEPRRKVKGGLNHLEVLATFSF